MSITYGANTISRDNAGVTDLYIAEVVDQSVIEASYSATVMVPHVRRDSIEGRETNTKKYPRWPALTAASIAETADLAQTDLDTTSVTVTVGEIGIQLALSDVLTEDDIISGIGEYGRQAGLAMADKMDADLAGLLSGHANVTTETNENPGPLSELLLLEAISELDGRDAPGPYCGVFHPVQLATLGASIVTNGGNVHSNDSTENYGYRPRGMWGSLFGVPLYQTTNAPTATVNTQAARVGAVFVPGQTYVWLSKRAVRTELDRDPSARLTEINITARYGVGELVDEWGETIYTTDTFNEAAAA